MQYMIIEHFRDGDPLPVYRRLRDEGRLVPQGLSIGDLGHGGLPALLPDRGVRGRRTSTMKLASPSGSRPGSVDKARRSPASLITLVAGREDPRTPVLHADEAPRFPPDATIFRIERMGMAHFGRNALAAVGAHRAERGIGFGSKLRSPLRHRTHPGWAWSSQSAVTYTSTSTSAPWTRTAYRATPRGAGGPSASPVLML